MERNEALCSRFHPLPWSRRAERVAAAERWRASPAPCWMNCNWDQRRKGSLTNGLAAEEICFFFPFSSKVIINMSKADEGRSSK